MRTTAKRGGPGRRTTANSIVATPSHSGENGENSWPTGPAAYAFELRLHVLCGGFHAWRARRRCGRAYDAKAASIRAMRAGSSGPASAAATHSRSLGPVLAAAHDGVDIIHRQRVAVSERSCRRTKLLGERAESSTTLEVPDHGVIRRQVTVERLGERATLDRADTRARLRPLFCPRR